MMHAIYLLLILTVTQGFDWVSFQMTVRNNAQGKTTRTDARIYFRSNGNLVTYLTEPTDMFILNNAQGELQVYNLSQNTVFKTVNYDYSTQNNTFYYFLGQVPNMGLEQAGYKIADNKIDDGMLVTNWQPPSRLAADISKVELVSDGDKNIFMGFYDREGEYFKKIYFYDFTDLRGVQFPQSITEISYIEDDSLITKTSFTDFNFDNSQDLEIMDFKVPDDAKLLK